MKIAEALSGLGRPVIYYPSLARFLGSIPAALFLAQLVYWEDKKCTSNLISKNLIICGESMNEILNARREFPELTMCHLTICSNGGWWNDERVLRSQRVLQRLLQRARQTPPHPVPPPKVVTGAFRRHRQVV